MLYEFSVGKNAVPSSQSLDALFFLGAKNGLRNRTPALTRTLYCFLCSESWSVFIKMWHLLISLFFTASCLEQSQQRCENRSCGLCVFLWTPLMRVMGHRCIQSVCACTTHQGVKPKFTPLVKDFSAISLFIETKSGFSKVPLPFAHNAFSRRIFILPILMVCLTYDNVLFRGTFAFREALTSCSNTDTFSVSRRYEPDIDSVTQVRERLKHFPIQQPSIPL